MFRLLLVFIIRPIPRIEKERKNTASNLADIIYLKISNSGPNMAAVLFLSFYILEIALVMATNSSRNMQLIYYVLDLRFDWKKNPAFLIVTFDDTKICSYLDS